MKATRIVLCLIFVVLLLTVLISHERMWSRVWSTPAPVKTARGQTTCCSHSNPVAAGAALGQGLPGSEQSWNPINQSPDMIDGASHPELIPDSAAYRLFFVTVAEPLDATDLRKARQRAYLKTAGLSDSDLEGAVQILAVFKAQLTDLVDAYNGSVVAANEAGEAPDLQTFMSQQADLVQRTRTALGSSLSPESSANLAAHIQREKRNMKVAKEDR